MLDIGKQLLVQHRHEKKKSRYDLLSLLLRANSADDIPGSQRLSDEEVIARRLLAIMERRWMDAHQSRQKYRHPLWRDTRPPGKPINSQKGAQLIFIKT
jgi:hypothetical protein